MKNPLTETVETELRNAGIDGAILIEESYAPESFGNGEAVYGIGRLRLHFVRDRGHDGVNIIVPGSTETFMFEDVSIAMGWQVLDEVVRQADLLDSDAPPLGPLPMRTVLQYIRDHISDLHEALEPDNVASTLGRLTDARSQRTKAMFG